jgi:hypothetical protein
MNQKTIHKKGYLLVELIFSALIIAVTGVAISYSFSKEMEAVSVSSQYSKGLQLCSAKLDEMEFKLRTLSADADWKPYQNQKGTFTEDANFSWESHLSLHRDFPDLMQIQARVSGLKGNREVNLSRWIQRKQNESAPTREPA